MSRCGGPGRALAVAATALLAAACGGGPQPPWTAPPATALDLRLAELPASVQLLEPVTLTLDLYAADGLDVDFVPALDPQDFRATVTTAPEVSLFAGRWRRTTIVARPLRGPGELAIPPFTAKSRDGVHTASTPERHLVVASALAGAGAAIEAPGAPFPAPFRGWWWIACALAALAAGALAWASLRRTRRRRPDAHAVALPAHVKAMRELQRLRTAPRTTPAEIDAFYVAVSGALRTYLEDRFGLRAPERTTEEFLRELEAGAELAKAHRQELERFLSQCDLVKFAALVPGEREHDTTWQLAAAFVEATRDDRAAAVVAAPAAATPAAPQGVA